VAPRRPVPQALVAHRPATSTPPSAATGTPRRRPRLRPCLTNLAPSSSGAARRKRRSNSTPRDRGRPRCFDAHFTSATCAAGSAGRGGSAAYEGALRVAPNAPQALVNLGLAVGDGATGRRGRVLRPRRGRRPAGTGRARPARRRAGPLWPDCLRPSRPSGVVARFPDSPPRALHLGCTSPRRHARRAIPCSAGAGARPRHAEAHNALGVALETLGRTDDAQRQYARRVRLRPDLAGTWRTSAPASAKRGDRRGRRSAAARSARAGPERRDRGALLANLTFSADLTAEQLRDEHVRVGGRYANALAPATRRRKRAHNAPVRVGYVFGEFRSPAAGAFSKHSHPPRPPAVFHVSALRQPGAARRGARPRPGLADVGRW